MDDAQSAAVSKRHAVVVAPEPTTTFEVFFEAETDILFHRLCLVTGNRAEAEEIAQEAFLKVWERWERVSEMGDPVGYLYRVAMNAFRNRYRRAALAVRKTTRPELRTDEFDAVDTRTGVARALAKLTPRQRAATVLVDLIGFGSEEAGRMLGIRAGTVRTLLVQARATLRDELKEGP